MGTLHENVTRLMGTLHENVTRLMGTLHENQYKFFIIFRSFLLGMRNV